MSNDKNSEYIAKMLSGFLGKSSNEIMNNMSRGDVNSALSGLSDEQRARINSILSDKELTNKLLSDKKVQDILRKLES